MEIVILGSGTGVPSLQRNASSLLVKIGNEFLLFDTGPGVVKRLLELGITYHDINNIFYTHFHTDHTLDLATFLFAAKYALSLRTKELRIVGPRGLARFYHGLLGIYGEVISPEAYQLRLQEIAEQRLQFESFNLIAAHVEHCPESLAYRIETAGRSLVYSGDTDVCEGIVRLGQNADLLILECSFSNQMKVTGHLSPGEAGEIARQCNCKKLVLTHLYPVCQQDEIVRQTKQVFRGEVIVASDLLQLRL